MMNRPADLPDFERPPLVEVVLSVQFAELPKYRTVHAGLLWDRGFRDRYPRFVEQPKLNPSFEIFGPHAGPPQFELKHLPGPEVPRLWLMDNDETELVQLQSDRFSRNWRKTAKDSSYPRYEKLRETFFSDLKLVSQFFSESDIGDLHPNQCEITYVNQLTLEGFDLRVTPGAALRFFAESPCEMDVKGNHLLEPEDCNFSVRYVIKDMQGKPSGRLFVKTQPWPGEAGLRLDLTVRGAPKSADLAAVGDFLDEGRKNIVQSFASMTRERMHSEWGRVQ